MKPQNPIHRKERIERETIFLNGDGKFPKKIVINESGRIFEYRLVRTKFGRFHLNK